MFNLESPIIIFHYIRTNESVFVLGKQSFNTFNMLSIDLSIENGEGSHIKLGIDR